MRTKRMPDRLNYSTKAKHLLEEIDDANYMGLGRKAITRTELFLFAMSLGVESGHNSEIVNPYTGGLVLDKSIDVKTRSLMYAKYITSLIDPDNELDSIEDKDQVYKMAEQYANTGFKIIADYLDNKKEKDLLLDLIMELDKKHKEIMQRNEDLEYGEGTANDYEEAAEYNKEYDL